MNATLLRISRPREQVPIHLFTWQGTKPVRAVVLMVHGMAEHIERYAPTAQALCEKGFVAAGFNHRGHGREWPEKRLGHFADKEGWDKVIMDMHAVMTHLKNEYPGVPFVLLGHSMGSFAAREFALRYGRELSALVLSGTGYYPRALCAGGVCMASLFPKSKPAPLLDKLVFSANNRPFAPARTPFDWLSRDNRQVDAYIADYRCGFVFTGKAYKDFFGGLYRLADRCRLNDLPKGLPVYFLSGDKDPVGQMGKGVRRVADEMKAAGLTRVTVKLYPGARHELFNEINQQEVWAHLTAWLDAALRP